MGHTSASRVVDCTARSGVPHHWRSLWPRGPSPHQPFTPFGGLGLLPEARGASLRGMPSGPGVFLENAGRVWVRPCARTHLKKALCRIPPVSRTVAFDKRSFYSGEHAQIKMHAQLSQKKCFNSVDWGCRIHRLHHRRGVRLPSSMSVPGMTLNNLMVRLLLYWSFGEYSVPFNCHHFMICSDLEW